MNFTATDFYLEYGIIKGHSVHKPHDLGKKKKDTFKMCSKFRESFGVEVTSSAQLQSIINRQVTGAQYRLRISPH